MHIIAKDTTKCVTAVVALALLTGFQLWAAVPAPTETNSATVAQVPQEFRAVARIKFSGSSTLHGFAGQVTSQPFLLLMSSNTWSAQSDVIAGEMTTANDGRDRNMWKMFSTNLFPKLRGGVTNATRPVDGNGKATLELWIRDVKADWPVKIIGWTETGDQVRFHAEWDVSLNRYKLKPPSVIGVIRVGDNVHLAADVTATRTSPGNTSGTTSLVTAPK